MTVLDIMSSNAESLTRDNRIWSTQQFLREQSISILAVQETHLTDQDVENFKRLIPDVHICVNNGTQRERGVAIFCTSDVNMEEINQSDFFNTVPGLADIEPGRLVIARITNEDVEFILINVYAPNDSPGRSELFISLTALIE
jgi:exonuclease III